MILFQGYLPKDISPCTHLPSPALGRPQPGGALLQGGALLPLHGQLEAALLLHLLAVHPGQHHRLVGALLLGLGHLQGQGGGGLGQHGLVVADL